MLSKMNLTKLETLELIPFRVIWRTHPVCSATFRCFFKLLYNYATLSSGSTHELTPFMILYSKDTQFSYIKLILDRSVLRHNVLNISLSMTWVALLPFLLVRLD